MSANSDPPGTQVARLVLDRTLRVRRGENVIVEAWSESLPWAKPFITEARRRGAHPLLLYEDEATFWDSLAVGASRSTGQVGSHEWAALSKTSAYVFFFGPAAWPRFDDLPAEKTRGVAAYNPEWYRRAARAKLRGARMYLGRTSPAAAQRWKVDLDAWREELVRASLVPPSGLHRLGARISQRLQRGKSVTVTHPNGTDLAFRLGKFPIQLDDALVDKDDLVAGNNVATIPGGVVGVAIDHTSAQGTIVGNHDVYPDRTPGPVSAMRWSFRDGHLADHSFGAGGQELDQAYSKAPRAGRDRLSYFSVGLNPELSHSPQMEDQELGALMFRVGGNHFMGGKNPSPFVAWMVVKGADASIDGRPLLEGGRIV
ncbi:MAG: hypothetical protein L3J97_00680 [Thermoplasmata archaeon]|nr:hypothetical protein [Thermoplasmata archaeon]